MTHMSSHQVPSSLRELLADILEISPNEVTTELTTDTLETWDSFRHLQVMLALEAEYGVQFDPQRMPELTSVVALQSELEKKGVSF